MMTIRQLLANTTPDRELFIRHILGVSKTELFLKLHEPFSVEQQKELTRLEKKRAAGHPMQYLIGRAWFYGLEYIIEPGVLIPRPETEVIVDRARAIAAKRSSCAALDIGTGPGTIAIAIAKHTSCPVTGMDISARALKLARRNAKKHDVKITFTQKNIRREIVWPRTDHVIIAANLPYLSDARMNKLSREVQREPKRALYGGHDGLDLYHALAKHIAHKKNPKQTVSLLCEIDPEQKTKLAALIRREFPNNSIEFHRDIHGDVRIAEITLS